MFNEKMVQEVLDLIIAGIHPLEACGEVASAYGVPFEGLFEVVQILGASRPEDRQ